MGALRFALAFLGVVALLVFVLAPLLYFALRLAEQWLDWLVEVL